MRTNTTCRLDETESCGPAGETLHGRRSRVAGRGGTATAPRERTSARAGTRSWLIATIAVLALAPAPARAVSVPCDTANPCTVGICTVEGDCEESVANNGEPCETYDSCTVGICSAGNCVESPANNGEPCETLDPCMEETGECSGGECVGEALTSGSACRPDLLGLCLTGTCLEFEDLTFCAPAFKCGEPTNPCAFNCNPLTGNCESFPLPICDDLCTTATCVPGNDFTYTCASEQNRPNGTVCYDGKPCNGALDECQSGACVGTGGDSVCGDQSIEGSEQCDDGDTEFSAGDYCDVECMLVPCGKPTNSAGAAPKTADALFTLRAAVGQVRCDPLVCDVDNSGTITTSDALRILRKAVGQAVTLECPVG